MGRKPKCEKEPEKPHQLTVKELGAYDDVSTDVMVDNTYAKGFKIRKNAQSSSQKYLPVRGVKEDDVPQILLHKLIVGKDVDATRKALLKLPGLKRYRNTLRSKAEREQFRKHFQKYIEIYSTDCPWEVSTTNRYTIVTHEAAVTARRRIKQGEKIKYLVGTMVPLTVEESTNLDSTQRNFSIVVSGRKKITSIFLGPARFANHDCDANGRLAPVGTDSMEVTAMKNIDIGDEITVSYGDDYFGPGNIECLCHTCELLERNGWTSNDASAGPRSTASTPTSEPASDIKRLPKKRGLKDDSASETSSSRSQTNKKRKLDPSPSKLQHSWTPPSSTASDVERSLQTSKRNSASHPEAVADSDLGFPTPLSIDHDVQASGSKQETSPASRLKRPSKLLQRLDRMTRGLIGQTPESLSPVTVLSPPASSASISLADSLSEPAKNSSTSESATVIKIESVETTKLENDAETILPFHDSQDSSQAMTTLTTTTISKTRGTGSAGKDTSELLHSVLPSVEEPCINDAATTARLTVRPLNKNIRVPGDYVLTRKLLAQPHDRWIKCTNARCSSCFVQPNGYQTRRECPRCERHSMLYGFPWPKTDPDPRKLMERKKKAEVSAYKRQGKSGKGTWVEGGGDEEERVMDHRTVHRFVFADAEREVSRKGLLREAEERRRNRVARLDTGTPECGVNGWSESVGREDSWSSTPEEGRRKSKRFVRDAVYAEA